MTPSRRARLNPHSLQFRVVATVLLLVTALVAGLLSLATSRMMAQAESAGHRTTGEMAAGSAAQIGGSITGPLDTVRTLASEFAALHETGGATRAQANALVRGAAASHRDYLGVSTAWEPNAFDGEDARHRNTAGHDATGRLIPYWYWDSGKLAVTPLTDYEKEGVGNWYLRPRQTGEPHVAPPFSYRVGGQDVLMTTASAPIMIRGTFAGVVAVDVRLTALSETIAAIKPYGSGYATLVTGDGVVVADPDPARIGTALEGDAAASVASVARDGTPADGHVDDERLGEDAMVVYQPVRIGSAATWVLVLVVPESAVYQEAVAMRTTLLLVGLLGLVLAGAAGSYVARSIIRPVLHLRDRVVEIASGDGDLTQRVDETRRDEVGQLGAAFNRFTDKIAHVVVQIQDRAGVLATSAGELDAVSVRLGEGARRTSRETSSASEAVSGVSDSVDRVASATEEFGASIREISVSVTEATGVGAEAVDVARSTEATVGKLGDSSTQIGEVVKVITSIAEQTNLLALNATIEAARAGEAGKGFAVVAGEVKDLARETGQATERISGFVAAIQTDTVEAVDAIGRIRAVIEQVNDYQTTIASAVEEQSATALEMSRGAADAARQAGGLAEVIRDVAAETTNSTQISEETARSAADITALAGDLRALADQFRVE